MSRVSETCEIISNIPITWIMNESPLSREREGKKAERIFEEIKTDNFLNLMKNFNLDI